MSFIEVIDQIIGLFRFHWTVQVAEYLEKAGHGEDLRGPLFCLVKTMRPKPLQNRSTPTQAYKEIV